MNRSTKIMALALAMALSHSAGMQAAQAGTISTEAFAAQVRAESQVSARRAQVLATLNRTDVAHALVEKGVDMDAARARVNALSDADVLALADQLDHAPAGGSDVLSAIIFIFVLLLITDILGLTKVFPFTRSIHH